MNKHFTLFTTTPPVGLTWEENEALPTEKKKPLLTNPALATADRMVCASCGAEITRASYRIAVGGSHRHIMPNSHGVDQEIGCFCLAPGCATAGHFSLDFSSGDTGYWQTSVCATCGNDLGWHYQGADGYGFFGLILDHLDAAPDRDPDQEAA